MTIANTFLRFGVLSLIVGVGLGIWMGANEEFTLRPVHAHINLIGWASMMIFGFFYRLHPDAASGWLPKAQLGLSIIGFIAMMSGLAAMLLGNTSLLPALLAGEIMTALSILIFAFLLFRSTGGRTTVSA
jgi:hypothetical protein